MLPSDEILITDILTRYPGWISQVGQKVWNDTNNLIGLVRRLDEENQRLKAGSGSNWVKYTKGENHG